MPVIAPIYLRWLLLLTTILLVAGFVTPMMTISKLVFFDHSFSIISGITQLWRDGQYILFLVIGSFSIILPIAKIAILFALLSPNTQHPEYRKNYCI